MSFMRDYGERYDWIVTVMKEWAFMLITEHYYYDEEYPSDEETRDLYRKGMTAFDGNARPIIWSCGIGQPSFGISIL